MLNEHGCSQMRYTRFMIKQLTLGIFLWALAIAVNANNESTFSSLCGKFSEPAIATTPYSHHGREEYDLIKKYPSRGTNRGSQNLHIPLIDHVYGTERNSNQDKIPFVERYGCEFAFLDQLKSTV